MKEKGGGGGYRRIKKKEMEDKIDVGVAFGLEGGDGEINYNKLDIYDEKRRKREVNINIRNLKGERGN